MTQQTQSRFIPKPKQIKANERNGALVVGNQIVGAYNNLTKQLYFSYPYKSDHYDLSDFPEFIINQNHHDLIEVVLWSTEKGESIV